MLRGRSGSAGQRHDVGHHRAPHACGRGFARDLCRCGLAPPLRLAQAFDGNRVAHRAAVAEQVGHRLGNAVDGHPCAGDPLVFDAAAKRLNREPGDAGRRIGESWAPGLAPDGDPDLRRHLVGQAVERECRGQTDDALGHKPGRLSSASARGRCGAVLAAGML